MKAPRRAWTEETLKSGMTRFRVRKGGFDESETFTTLTPGRRWARRTIADIEGGTFVPASAGRGTVASVCPLWMATKATKARRTRTGYRSVWRSRVEPTFGRRRVASITRDEIISWIVGMHQEGKSPSRIKQAYLVLAGILDYAAEEGLRADNPARTMRVRAALPTITRRTIKAWEIMEPSEIEALIEAAPERYRAMFAVLAYAGLRFGEAAALQRQDIGPSGIEVANAISESTDEETGEQRRYLDGVKSHAERFVRVPPSVLRRIVSHMRVHVASKDPEAFIFTNEAGEWLAVGNFGRTIWPDTLDSAGLTHRKMHRLRATAASLMLRAGASLEYIRKQLGHAEISTTSRYLAAFMRDEEGVIEQMDRSIEGANQADSREPLRPHSVHAAETDLEATEALER